MKPSVSMEEAGGLDAASLAEALRLVLSAFRAMEGLAAEIHSCHRTRRKWELTRCRSKVADPELDLLIAHLLQIWSICAGAYPQRAGDRALALQARDAVHFIKLLQDKVQYGKLQPSSLVQILTHGSKLLSALRWCGCSRLLVALFASKPTHRFTRGIKAVNQETRKIGNLLCTLPPQPVPGSASQVLQTGVFVGRDKDRDDVVQMLVKPCAEVPPPDMMVSIVGTAGIGKTTLAQMVFNDTRVAKHFDVRCWVSVSTSSNRMDLAAEILRSAQPAWDTSDEKMADFQMLQSELRRLVTSKRYLIVIDDICNGMDDIWLDMMAPLQSADIGSRILATSRMNTVPHFLGASHPYPVNPLNSDDCWAILKEHAFPSGRENAYPDLHPIGKQIAAKINGSPLAAKLVGGLLGDTRSKNHWMKIMKTGLQDNALLPALRLSYKYLPVHLKRCFAYCSLFPHNYKFDPAQLSRLWIAEGFVQPQGRAGKSMEDIAKEYFGLLLSRSFFQEIKLGSSTYYLMHDLLHDLAKSVAAEDCFHIEDGMKCDIPSTVRHLSVTEKSLVGLTSFSGLEELLTLFIRPSLPCSSSCFQEDFAVNLESILKKSKHLRVLDLSGYNSKELPHCIYDLLHLRYLSIHGSIQRLPESIGKLLHLQTLCISGKCSLEKLPVSVSMLVNLRHLMVEMKYTAGLVGIGRLANLQGSLELHIEKLEGRKPEELRNIDGLHGLVIKCLENVSGYEEACKAELNKKLYLNSLNLEWSSASRNSSSPADAKVLEGLRPHHAIKVLNIRRYCGAKTPSWLQSLQQLRSLNLINCRSLCILPPLGNLGSLRYLHMKEMCAVDQIGQEFYGTSDVAFPSLSVLEIDDFPKLCEWAGREDKNSFPCLERVSLMDCPELIKIPLFCQATREITIERTRLIPYMRLAPFSSSSEMLQLDVCTSSVILNRLLYKHHIQSIAVLNISGAEQLAAAEQLGSLVSLQRLQLSRCNLTDQTLRSFLQDLPCLSSLEIIDLPNITSLPVAETVKFCTVLTELCIRNCQSLCSLSSLQYLASLKYLVIERCPEVTATSFPVNFMSLSYLKVLRMSYCTELQSLPDLPSSLETLYIFRCHPELSRKSRNMKGHYVEKLAIVPSVLIE
ncbi:putative disease resistance protein RGA1 [Triticum dicoccoides]|uniref:putative disease resistance protein RGA1 n=1 Tax=Triticum dicoccoides TaxID=85692 RepID=UPI000E7B5153|nr:putative disease resistance protein RGA1 [Triticum dicoccoides]